jgi:hypothetical protein
LKFVETGVDFPVPLVDNFIEVPTSKNDLKYFLRYSAKTMKSKM